MKRILLNTKISKIYIISVILITLLLLTSYFSYAMFTVTKEKSNAISIVTGNLTYELLIDGVKSNTLTVAANSRQDFIVTLNNPNSRVARFNFYYLGDLPNGVDIGYIERNEFNNPPLKTGINLEPVSTIGSSNTYIVRLTNITSSSVTINLGVSVGLDYNDLNLPSDGHLLRKITSTGTVSEVIEDDIMNRLNYEDNEQTFVTGDNPYNYIWYSGKLWRVVSIDSSDNSIKLVTQWNISSISYSSGDSAFAGSYMEEWLNDTSIDEFLGNLRDYENFIKLDSVWNATETTETTKPAEITLVTDPVGLLNIYEYTMSYSGTDSSNGYLNNGLIYTTLSPTNNSNIWRINYNGTAEIVSISDIRSFPIRPTINLTPEIKIIAGDGSIDNPYRLEGDNDVNLSGTLLNTRYSGEYIRFGTGKNNLYRIVNHETSGLTKITSAEPLKNNDSFIFSGFGNNNIFSSTNIIGTFLNNDYLNLENGYLTSNDIAMIEDETTWYIGTVDSNESHKLAKYTNTTDNILTSNTTKAKIGLLRLGELMSGQFNRYATKGDVNIRSNTYFWSLTRANNAFLWLCTNSGYYTYGYAPITAQGIKPSLNLKQSVIITGGDGTLQNPFIIELAN